jgi:uncharacterized integral membrane protein
LLCIYLVFHLHQVNPFLRTATNTLAHFAQIIICLTVCAALILETELSNRFEEDNASFSFGLILCIVNVAIIGIAFAASLTRLRREKAKRHMARDRMATKVEW